MPCKRAVCTIPTTDFLLTRPLRGACFPPSQHSQRPLRSSALENLFSQAFYLSLEHSFLFGACRTYLQEQQVGKKPSSGYRATGSAAILMDDIDGQMARGPAILMGATPLGPTVDFSALRSGHLAEPLDATTTKAIEMQIERLLVLAGGPTFEVQLRERTQAPLSSPSQPVAVGGGADGAALRKRPQSATPERDLLVRMGGMSSSLPEGVGLGGSPGVVTAMKELFTDSDANEGVSGTTAQMQPQPQPQMSESMPRCAAAVATSFDYDDDLFEIE